MTEDWIMTQNGAVRKSIINFIIPQDDGNGKKNIVLVTKDKDVFLLYNGIENNYTASIIIDNVLTFFDENHVPQIDLQKEKEKSKEAKEEKSPEKFTPSKSDDDAE